MLQRAGRGLTRWRCGSLRGSLRRGCPLRSLMLRACVAWPDALELRLVAGRVAARLPFAEPDVAARRALQGPDVPLAHARRALLLPALAASVPAHWHSMAVSLQPKSELLSIAKVFS